MSIWKKSTQRSKEVEASEQLVQRRDEHLKKMPEMLREWKAVDSGPVWKAAEILSVAVMTGNHDRIYQARESLKQAIWKRDGIKGDFDRILGELNAEIQVLNDPVIFEKREEWSKSLLEVKKKKIIEKIEGRTNIEKGRREVRFRSNLQTIARGEKKLVEAMSALMAMRTDSLSKVLQFVEEVETEAAKIDFGKLEEAKDWIPELNFYELAQLPGTNIQEGAWILSGRVAKDFNLPFRKEA